MSTAGLYRDCEKAIALNPEYSDGYNNRGNVYYDLKEYDKAISDYNMAIYIEPENVNAYINRAKNWAV